MMKQEFEALAKYEVSDADYTNIIEPMYMATNLDKEDFIKCIDRKRFALKPRWKVEKEICKVGEQIKSVCIHRCYTEELDTMCELIHKYIERFFPGSNFYLNYSQIQGCHYPTKAVIWGRDYKTVYELDLI